jgi:hypothetical protein
MISERLRMWGRQALAAPAFWNEGVGEHVRTRFHLAKSAREIADFNIRTERRKPIFFCRTDFR